MITLTLLSGSSDGLFALSSNLEHRTYFSPDLDDRQIAFIPWEFGYIALVTNPHRDKIESISFVRGHIGNTVNSSGKPPPLLRSLTTKVLL